MGELINCGTWIQWNNSMMKAMGYQVKKRLEGNFKCNYYYITRRQYEETIYIIASIRHCRKDKNLQRQYKDHWRARRGKEE